jgi:hypothetical protein
MGSFYQLLFAAWRLYLFALNIFMCDRTVDEFVICLSKMCLQVSSFIALNQHDTAGFSRCDDHLSFGSYGEAATPAHDMIATVTRLCDPALAVLTDNLNALQFSSKVEQLSLF